MDCGAKSTVYEQIAILCKERGISVAQMCKDTGLRQGLISDLKYGRSKSLSEGKLVLIADYFMVSVDCLLGRTKK